jgi:DNA helicase IV
VLWRIEQGNQRRNEEIRNSLWLAEQEKKIKNEAIRNANVDMHRSFRQDFLNSNKSYNIHFSQYVCRSVYQERKQRYVQFWLKNNLDFKLDLEQAGSIGAVETHTQVIARAGSGKTFTLVSRAVFLQKHCGVPSSEILLLAFNKKAAKEIEERLKKYLVDDMPHVMTFHALASRLVHQTETLIYDEANGSEQQSRSIQTTIDEYLKQPEIREKIRNLMVAHFREDWNRIIFGGYDKGQKEMLEYRRSLPNESLDGKYVKSFGEKTIANFLFEHNIPYKYECHFWWDGISYRPDFTLPKGEDKGLIIEYFGMTGDPDYDEMSEKKRQYWEAKSPEWQFLEFSHRDLGKYGVDGFCDLLKQKLESYGIVCNRLSEEEIWEGIKHRAIDRFTKTMKGFIGRCRKKCLTVEMLAQLVDEYQSQSHVERQFLVLAQIFYQVYLERLQVNGEEDFDGLMQRSAQKVEAGTTTFGNKSGGGDLRDLRYIMIDEYQDFSELFYGLVRAIQRQNPQVQFFCVGDDWQAINGFAGSDLQFYRNFSTYFQPATKPLQIATNYRSATSIVNAGNALMQGLGSPARSHKTLEGLIRIADLSSFELSPQESEKYQRDKITPAILRLIDEITRNGKHIADVPEKSGIVLLSRNNKLHWDKNTTLEAFLSRIQASLPEDVRRYVSTSTTHKYKGLEKQVVIILDAVEGCYPSIHPDSVFTRVLGDRVEDTIAEERRLFYVALTRAVEHLFIVTDKEKESPFLKDLNQRFPITPVNWSSYPPLLSGSGKHTVKICPRPKSAFVDYKQLRGDGFKQDKRQTFWWRNYSDEQFSAEAVLNGAPWLSTANNIEFHVCDEQDNRLAMYQIAHGKWQEISA